jgi:hypothetical protein
MTGVLSAPPDQRSPGRRIRFAALRREPVLASLGALALAVLMTWPTMRHPASTVPQDIWDPTAFAWILAWPGHALLTQPGALWQANTFFPEADTFAFSDSLLGYLPLSLIGSGPDAALIRYNVMFVLIHALAFGGAYALARQLGARWPGAVVAGAAFAYAPWRLAHGGHPNVISVGGMALAFAALAYGHGYSFRGGYQRDRVRPGWAAAGWAVACWQLLLGFAVGLPFAYVVALVCVAAGAGWLVAGRPQLPKKLLAADLLGGVAFALTGAFMAMPYLRVAERYPNARRGEADVEFFSAPLRGLFIAPPESKFWGDRHALARAELPFVPEMTLLPGIVLAVLAIVGLGVSVWSARQRLALAAATAISIVLALGTTVLDGKYTYLPLLHHLPGWDALRTPGRLMIWTTLGLGLLAAGAVTAIGEALARRGESAGDKEPPGPVDAPEESGEQAPAPTAPRAWPAWVTAVLLLPGLLVLAEGANKTPHPEVPAQPVGLRGVEGPLLVLPSTAFGDMHVSLWSTDGFPKVMNGASSFNPPSLAQAREITKTFPDAASIDYLRGLGVRKVVLLPGLAGGTPWEQTVNKPIDGLPVTRTDRADAVIYTLEPQ